MSPKSRIFVDRARPFVQQFVPRRTAQYRLMPVAARVNGSHVTKLSLYFLASVQSIAGSRHACFAVNCLEVFWRPKCPTIFSSAVLRLHSLSKPASGPREARISPLCSKLPCNTVRPAENAISGARMRDSGITRPSMHPPSGTMCGASGADRDNRRSNSIRPLISCNRLARTAAKNAPRRAVVTNLK